MKKSLCLWRQNKTKQATLESFGQIIEIYTCRVALVFRGLRRLFGCVPPLYYPVAHDINSNGRQRDTQQDATETVLDVWTGTRRVRVVIHFNRSKAL